MVIIMIQIISAKKNRIVLILIQFTIAFTALIFSVSTLDNLLQHKKQVEMMCEVNTVQVEVQQQNPGDSTQGDLGKYARIISTIAEKKIVDKIGIFERKYLWETDIKELDPTIRSIMVNPDLIRMTKFKLKAGSLEALFSYTGKEKTIPIVVSESISKNYRMGNQYEFYVDGESKARTFQVVGIVDEPNFYWSGGATYITDCVDYNSRFLIMPAFKEYQSTIPYVYNTLLSISDIDSQDAVLNTIRDIYAKEGISVEFDTMQNEIHQYYESHKNVVIATLLFSSIILILSILGCIGTVLLNMIARKKEFGIYFALGLSKYHLYRIVLGEILVLLLISYFLAEVVAGLIIYVAMKDAMLYISATNMIVVFGVMLFCTLCTSIIPLKKLSKLDPIKLLNERGK